MRIDCTKRIAFTVTSTVSKHAQESDARGCYLGICYLGNLNRSTARINQMRAQYLGMFWNVLECSWMMLCICVVVQSHTSYLVPRTYLQYV
jgi:hypothetical protein